MRAVCLIGLLALLSGTSLATAAPTVEKPVKAEPATPPLINASTSPQAFVNGVAVGNLYEIQAGQLAETKGRSKAIKSFARRMVMAHDRIAADLEAALKTGNLSITPPTGLDTAHQKMLDELKGARAGDFDRLYEDQQATAHQDALTLMHTYVLGGNNAALKNFAKGTIPVIRRHIKMVETLKSQPA